MVSGVLVASLLVAFYCAASAQDPPSSVKPESDPGATAESLNTTAQKPGNAGSEASNETSAGVILRLSYSPDGESIATGGDDGMVRLFSASTGEEIRTLVRHDGPVTGIAYSPDGEEVLSGGADGRHLRSGGGKVGVPIDPQRIGPARRWGVTSVAYSPNGLSFLTTSRNQITLWGPGIGETHTLISGTNSIACSAYSPDCSRIVSGSRDKSVTVWDVVSHQAFYTLRGHDGPVTCVAYSPDGKWIVSGSSDNTLKIWDAKTGMETRSLKGHTKGVNAIAISGDGRRIATGGDDHQLILWDLDGDLSSLKILGHTDEVVAVAFSPDGTRIVSSGKDLRVQVWDATTLSPLVSLGKPNVSVGTSEALKGNVGGTPLAEGSTASRDQPLLTIEVPGRLVAFPVWSADGNQLVAATGSSTKEGEFRVWNADDGTEVANKKGFRAVFWDAVIDPERKRVISSAWDQNSKNTFTGWNIDQGTELFRFTLVPTDGSRFESLAFSLDGRRFAIGSFDPHVRIYDTATGNLTLRLRPGVRGPAAESVAFSSDGKRIAAASLGTLRIWDAETGMELLNIPRNEGWRSVSSLAFNPDGTRIAAAQGDDYSHTGEIQVWDAVKGAELLTIEGHKKEVVSVTFSPDGKLIASGSKDHTIRLWDAENGSPVHRYNTSRGNKEKPRDWGMRVTFSPDGKRLATSERSENSTIRIWDVSAVAPRTGVKPEAKGTIDKPHPEEAPGIGGQPAVRQVLGGNKFQWPKGLNMVSRATPKQRLKNDLGAFNTLAYSSDSKRIATATNKTVTIWDAEMWTEIRSFVGHEGHVERVAFSPDGKRLVSGGKDTTLRIWDVEKGTELTTLRGHVAEVVCLAVSPDGKLIASGGKDNSIRLWDLEAGTLISVMNGHKYWINSLSFSPDGRRLVCGSGSPFANTSAELKIWDVAKEKELLALKLHKGAVTNVAFSPDGQRIAATLEHRQPNSRPDFGETKVLDAETGKELFSLFEDETNVASSVAYRPDGRYIVTSSQDWSIRFWDADNGFERHRIEYATIENLVFSPDGKHLAGWGQSVNRDEIKIWDASEDHLSRQRVYQTMRPVAAQLQPAVVIPPQAESQNIRSIDAPDLEMVGQPLMTLKGHFAKVYAVAYSPDGRWIASAGTLPEDWIRIWDAATGRPLHILKGHTDSVSRLAFSPDGKRIVSPSRDGTARVWDIERGEQLFLLEDHGSVCLTVVFSRDGKYVVGGLADRSLRIWDAANGREIRRLKASPGIPLSLDLSPDGKWIVCGNSDKTVTLHDFHDEVPIRILTGHDVPIQSVAFSPDGKLIASCGGDEGRQKVGEVKLWDAVSSQEIRSLKGHSDRVLDLAFSPDSQQLVTGGMDRLLKVWDVRNGRELMSFRAHGIPKYVDGVHSVAFSPDGKRILSGGDKEVKIWDAADVKLVAASAGMISQHSSRYWSDIESVAFSPDGKRVVSGASDGVIKVWDTATGKELITVQPHLDGLYGISVRQVAFSPDGHQIVSCGDDRKVKLWNADTGQSLKTMEGHTGSVTGIAFSPDGTKIVSGSPDRVIRVWDATSGAELLSHKEQPEGVTHVAFSPDGKLYVSSYAFKTVLFDLTTGQPIRELEAAADNFQKAAFSPDGEQVISSSRYGIVIADVATGKQLVKVEAHKGDSTSSNAVFSPDGKTFAGGGSAGSLTVWDTVSGEERTRNFGDVGAIRSLAFSADGKFLVSGSARKDSESHPGSHTRNGKIQLWDAATSELIRTFEPQPLPEQSGAGTRSNHP